jgi:CDP-diacylglycerol--glycerol-3-phosphate 3-phosphatidyltransferase
MSRVALAPVAVAIAWFALPAWLWVSQFVLAALSDLYDGKLARRWGVVTERLRLADSVADTIYVLGVLVSLCVSHPEIVRQHAYGIGLLVALEAGRWLFDLLRFGRVASYHAISAKVFAASLVVAVIAIMGFGADHFLWPSIAFGVVSMLEGFAMSLVLPSWTHDVPHLGVALKLRAATA